MVADFNVRFLSLVLLLYSTEAFAPQRRTITSRGTTPFVFQFVGDLWEEVIEFSTLGPGERKMLKAKREAANQDEESPFAGLDDIQDADSLSLEAFQSVVQNMQSPSEKEVSVFDSFDGYALRDLLVDRWAAPLDVGFQRQAGSVYCSVLPVAFGSRKCQHDTELEYLMHLQGVVEVLRKYDNLELFLSYLGETGRTPKAGTDSVPFRMQLSEEQLDRILG